MDITNDEAAMSLGDIRGSFIFFAQSDDNKEWAYPNWPAVRVWTLKVVETIFYVFVYLFSKKKADAAVLGNSVQTFGFIGRAESEIFPLAPHSYSLCE